LYYLRIFISGDFNDPNSPTVDHKNSPLSQSQSESQSQSQSQNINNSQIPSNILENNQIIDFDDGENLTQDPHELQNNGFDEYGFIDENDFEKSHLNDRIYQNYSREDEDDNGDGDRDENENERMSESYTKYSPQNIPTRRRGSQLQQQQQQVIVRNNFNKNNHQKPRPSPPQRPLSEITVRNTKMSRNPSEFNLNSQNDYPEFEPVSRKKNGNWENREIAIQRSRNSEYGSGYSQNTELNDRMRNNQNSNSNTNSNQNNSNLKNKNSK
jgi:hypothetical protein